MIYKNYSILKWLDLKSDIEMLVKKFKSEKQVIYFFAVFPLVAYCSCAFKLQRVISLKQLAINFLKTNESLNESMNES